MRGLRLFWLVLVSLALLASAAAAAPRLREATSPGGIAFLYAPTTGTVQSAIAIAWKRGYGAIAPGKEATASVGSQVLLAGPKALAEGDYAESLTDLQATATLTADMRVTLLTIAAPDKSFAEAAAFVAPILTEPRLAERTVRRIRKRLADSMREQLQKPQPLAASIAQKALLGDHPLVRARDPELIEAITTEDIDAWRQATFAREDAVIIAAGVLDEATFGQAVDKIVGSLPALPPGATVPPERPRSVRPVTILMEADVAQAGLVLVGTTSLRAGLELSPAAIANQTLGGGLDTRLSRAVRQELGATYGIRSAFELGLGDPPLFLINFAADPGKAVAALERTRAEYARWMQDGVTAEEFAAARAIVAQSVAQSLRLPAGLARARAVAIARGMTPAEADGVEADLGRYGLADINGTIAGKFPAEPLLTVIVAPKRGGFPADCIIQTTAEIDRCRRD